MVTLDSAQNALKSVYLDVISNQLNDKVNPLLSKISQSTKDVWGKEVVKMAPFGINGGIGAGTETGSLPTASANNYVKFVSTLKNLYGNIEISDKAIRASENNTGAFVNLLNDEMEGLIKASSFNFGRMLFGDGSGKLGTITDVTGYKLTLDTVKNVIEGMLVDAFTSAGAKVLGAAKITAVDRANKVVTISSINENVVKTCYLTVQGSSGLEITGLGAIFKTTGALYGVDRATNAWMNPQITSSVGTISDTAIQTAIDNLEENTGSEIDYIVCASNVKRFYQSYLASYRRNIDVMELNGGFRAISYNGIPLVSDRFCPDGEMYLLNSKDFTLHQLCDWKWLESENGSILKQNAGFATYSATLVKYAELICDKPCGQGKLAGITG